MNDCCRLAKRIALTCAALMVLVLGSITASAQTFRGTILGTVTDSSGAAVPGATVTIRNLDTGLIRTAQTSDDGSYAVPELPIGNYSVTVEKSGFTKFVANSVKVDVAVEHRVDAALKPGNVSQEVVVSAETLPQIETTSNTLGGVMTPEQVTNIPANGRDFQKLIFLTPGIAGSPDEITDSPGSFGIFSSNGARGRANNFLLDGTDMNDGFRNDPVINEAGVFGDPATILPLESIQELHVLSNYEAEYGRNAGAVINIVTKSGTNQFHGTALEYFRNTVLDARNFFDSVGTTKSPFHNNQFGGSLGGPIVKDKTFFFADYEGQRESGAQTSLACVPDFSQFPAASNPVIAALLARNPWPKPNISNPSTDIGCPNGPNLSTATPFNNDIDSVIAKVDHSFSESNLLSGRYYFGNSTQLFPLALVGGGVLPNFNTHTPTRVQLVAISDVWTISPTKVNEARIGWNRFAEGFFPQDQNFNPNSIGLDTGSSVGGLPFIGVGSFAKIGASASDPRHRVDSNWDLVDNFSWKLNKHDIKFGYQFRRTSIQQNLGTNFRGKLNFATLEDFLAGTPIVGNGAGTIAEGDGVRHEFQNNHGLYIQDSYRATSNLTLNAGLRWDYFGVATEKNNLMSNFSPTLGLVQVGTAPFGQLYHPDYRNFAPRVSFAYDLFGKGKTVIRAGYGIFYDSFSQDIFLGHLPFPSSFDPGPAYNPIGPATISSGSALGGTITAGSPVYGNFAPTGDAFGVNPNIRTPYMENYNLNIQQQLTKNIVLQVGYVGSQGHRLYRFVDLNQPSQATIDATDLQFAAVSADVNGRPCLPFGGTGCIPAFNSASRNFPQFSPLFFILQEQASADSNYNSLQTSLHFNSFRGLQGQLNYVWSHSIDNASDSEDFVPNASQPNDSTQPNLERGNSNFDIRQRFSFNYVYTFHKWNGRWKLLTDGWGLDGAVILQTGQPFQLNYNFEGDYDGSGEGFGRPDVVSPIQYNQQNPAQFLNLTSFMVPCLPTPSPSAITAANPSNPSSEQICLPGTRHFGNEGRNSLAGPTFRQMDIAAVKDFPITERLTAQFRVEIYNLFNHPNFSNPFLPLFIADAAFNGTDTAVNSATYGHSLGFFPLTATGDVGIGNPFLGGGAPRGIQLAVKFSF